MAQVKLTFLGAGKMATAIAAGLVQQGRFQTTELCASDVSAAARAAFTARTGCACLADNAAAVEPAATVLLAVKPQDAAAVLAPLRPALAGKLLVSIAAGLRLARLQEWTGLARVIRVMPNTPATVNRGATVFSAAPGATAADRDLARAIFSAVGTAVELPEAQLDAVTALSGSGPAFLFVYVEAMVDGARQLGLDPAVAQALLVQTIAGAAEMLQRQLGTPAELRQAVTSKGGTTAAGLASLDRDDFHGALGRCLQAAAARAAELGR